MIYAVLLAAGYSTRMVSSTIPKQFQLTNGEPILRMVCDKFLVCSKIDKIIVVAPSIWLSHAKDILKNNRYNEIEICEGGKTRQESLFKALKYINDKYHSTDDDIVISHDVARPFLSLRVIEENISTLNEYDACDTVIPSSDTIVVSNNNKTISNIPDRRIMYQGQTPQSFRLKKFLELYSKLDDDYLNCVTDAARILHDHGIKVGLVIGDEFNIKITTDYDFRIASFLIGETNA